LFQDRSRTAIVWLLENSMDPNLFAIDTERLFEVLVVILVLSFFIERALALPFENRWLVEPLSRRGLKEPISFLVSFGVCRFWDFDAISVLLVRDKTQLWGQVLTAGIIAGGSKASIKFFHNVIGAMSTAEAERQKLNKARADADAAMVANPEVVRRAEAASSAAEIAAEKANAAAATVEKAAPKPEGTRGAAPVQQVLTSAKTEHP
jgi:hypothetical protein